MDYISNVHCWIEDGTIPMTLKSKLDSFIKSIS